MFSKGFFVYISGIDALLAYRGPVSVFNKIMRNRLLSSTPGECHPPLFPCQEQRSYRQASLVKPCGQLLLFCPFIRFKVSMIASSASMTGRQRIIQKSSVDRPCNRTLLSTERYSLSPTTVKLCGNLYLTISATFFDFFLWHQVFKAMFSPIEVRKGNCLANIAKRFLASEVPLFLYQHHAHFPESVPDSKKVFQKSFSEPTGPTTPTTRPFE